MKDYNIQNVYYEQVDRVLNLVEKYNSDIRQLYADETLEKSSQYIQSSHLKQEFGEAIGKMKFSKHTMIYLLLLLDSEKYKKISRSIMNILFGYPNTSFF